jgi:hypothetical protein
MREAWPLGLGRRVYALDSLRDPPCASAASHVGDFEADYLHLLCCDVRNVG